MEPWNDEPKIVRGPGGYYGYWDLHDPYIFHPLSREDEQKYLHEKAKGIKAAKGKRP